MRRLYRITRIVLAGKYGYLKKFHKWMRGQFVRDLLALTPSVIADMQRKYGGDWVIDDESGQWKSEEIRPTFNKPKYIEDAK